MSHPYARDVNAKKVINALELQADLSLAELASMTGLKPHVVRYVRAKLLADGIIRPVTVMNLHRIGVTIYTLLFSAAGDKAAARDRLVEDLVASPEVLWVGVFGGEYQYGIALSARTFSEVVVFLMRISKMHPRVFFDKALAVQISTTGFPRKTFSNLAKSIPPITLGLRAAAPYTPDELDIRILQGLTQYGGASHREIASHLGVPLSTFVLRYHALRKEGVIAGEIMAVDSAALGLLSFKLLVYVKGLDPALSKRMHAFCAQHEHCVYLIECLGAWGFEIGVEVPQAEMANDVIQQVYDEFGDSISTIKTLTKFRYPKYTWFPQHLAE